MEVYVLRNLVMRYGSNTGLHGNQKEFIWHILDYDHNGKKISWPSLASIGKRMGIKDAGVRKIAKSLVKKKLIKITSVQGKSNIYDYSRLIEKFKPFLEAEAKNGKFLDESDPYTKVQGLTSVQGSDPSTFVKPPPAQKLRGPLHKSSGDPSTFVQGNTVNNTANKTVKEYRGKGEPLLSSNQKQPLAKYRDEWDQWKAERGEKMLTDTLGEKPIFTEKDMAAFCKLRGYGKTLSEITYRFMVYCRTPNKWYAEKGYAFYVFAENYSSFGAKMQQIKSTVGNGKQDKKITTAPESAYFSATKQESRSDDEIERENKKMLETIQALKKQEGITSDARAAA